MAAMSAIDLYEILKRVPNTEAAEARSAADSVATAGDMATKADLAKLQEALAKLKADLAELKAWLAWRMVAGVAILLAAMSAGFGFMGFLLSVN